MFQKFALLSVFVLSFSFTAAHAQDFESQGFEKKRHSSNDDFRRKHNYPRTQEERDADDRFETASANPAGGDSQIVAAAERRRRVNFVEGSGMVVTQLLPDDNSGLQHQKWVVKLSNGESMEAVYNTDMCPRVPLKVGDVVAMGGQFIYTNQGPLLHWLHYDPKSNRPDGYVSVNGVDYCRDGARH